MSTIDESSIIKQIKNGDIGILPTDTLYGLVGSALNKDSVEKIYALRKRDTDKPMIILLPEIETLKDFDINLSSKDLEILEKLWPNKVSVILPCTSKKFAYLHRGKNSLAFRIPKKESLRALLRETGPLVAPSANTQGEAPAETIAEARDYFGDTIDFYLDEGLVQSKPSTIVSLKNGDVTVIRNGEFAINNK